MEVAAFAAGQSCDACNIHPIAYKKSKAAPREWREGLFSLQTGVLPLDNSPDLAGEAGFEPAFAVSLVTSVRLRGVKMGALREWRKCCNRS